MGVKGKKGRAAFFEAHARAKEEAKLIVDHLIKEGKLDKEAAGNAVLIDMAAVVLTRQEKTNVPYFSTRDRIQAARIVLDYTLEKPATQNTTRIETAEDFLTGVFKEATGKKIAVETPDEF